MESQDRMYIVDNGASLHILGITSVFPKGTEDHPEDEKATWKLKPQTIPFVPQAQRMLTSWSSTLTFK